MKEGGGSWVARRFIGQQRYSETKLGIADDLQDPDGISVHSFRQAQNAARAWWKDEEWKALGIAPVTGPYTVKNAIEDYLAARERRGSKGVRADRYAAEARVIPKLGAIEISKLTAKHIRDWHEAVAYAPKLVRTKKFATERATRPVGAKDPEEVRARRSTANRLLTVLKAALNHAFHEGRASAGEPWRKVRPFRGADAPVVRFLKADECTRLVNACDPAFRNLVRGALLTGCRYGELTRMHASDFNAEAGIITVRESKAGKPRHVALTDEGGSLFGELTAGNAGHDPIFIRDDGKTWGPSHQQRPLDAASARAKIEPAATFHILRHTYASALAMRGAPIGVIAAQLGHSDTRMTEKHYAHLSPNYVAETVRAALPVLGILDQTNVAPLKKRA
ncbi:MAG: Tyrosine recombinase XerD [Beijerinckiaceae bacterium]|nr:MAG: Tyrosine recombinase XerD [Beijerinckiaceae bacterium]